MSFANLFSSFPRLLLALALLSVSGFLSSCTTTGGSAGSSGLNRNHPLIEARNARISQEPRGDYYIGRRYWIDGTRFWGFIRKPGQTWDDSQMVVFNEQRRLAPDRLPEINPSGLSHGYDHNYEYRLQGYFSGDKVYDPNSNQILPEFVLTDYQLIDQDPGFLFHPNQRFKGNEVPRPPRY